MPRFLNLKENLLISMLKSLSRLLKSNPYIRVPVLNSVADTLQNIGGGGGGGGGEVNLGCHHIGLGMQLTGFVRFSF
jgi:hypothetical protein